MMNYCSNCGAEIPEGLSFCENCGTPVPQATAAESENFNQQTNVNVTQENHLISENDARMKWFHFTIYAVLFMFAAVYLALAVLQATGFVYIHDSASVYKLYPGMQALNITMAAFNLIMAVMAVVIRQRLAQYKKNGPGLLLGWMWASLIGLFSYEMISCMIAGNLTIGTKVYPIQYFALYVGIPLLIIAIYVIFNTLYFKSYKRRDLFTN